jgi:deoxyribonuclease-4
LRLGVHVSIGKGFAQAVQNAAEAGCESFQIFAGNPRGWARKPLSQIEADEFIRARRDTGLGPVAVHLSYLPNLASSNPELYEKSVLAIGEDFHRANLLGADFFVVHPGKHGKEDDLASAISKVANGLRTILEKVEGPTRLLLENQAGAGHEIAARLEDLGTLLDLIDMPERTGVCFDTCHAYAAGYDLQTEAGWKEVEQTLKSSFMLSAVYLLHLNDAKGILGGHLDRHAHWGEGSIGDEGFRWLIRQTGWGDIPGILETPLDKPDDDRRNLAFLRHIIEEEAK